MRTRLLCSRYEVNMRKTLFRVAEFDLSAGVKLSVLSQINYLIGREIGTPLQKTLIDMNLQRLSKDLLARVGDRVVLQFASSC